MSIFLRRLRFASRHYLSWLPAGEASDDDGASQSDTESESSSDTRRQRRRRGLKEPKLDEEDYDPSSSSESSISSKSDTEMSEASSGEDDAAGQGNDRSVAGRSLQGAARKELPGQGSAGVQFASAGNTGRREPGDSAAPSLREDAAEPSAPPPFAGAPHGLWSSQELEAAAADDDWELQQAIQLSFMESTAAAGGDGGAGPSSVGRPGVSETVDLTDEASNTVHATALGSITGSSTLPASKRAPKPAAAAAELPSASLTGAQQAGKSGEGAQNGGLSKPRQPSKKRKAGKAAEAPTADEVRALYTTLGPNVRGLVFKRHIQEQIQSLDLGIDEEMVERMMECADAIASDSEGATGSHSIDLQTFTLICERAFA